MPVVHLAYELGVLEAASQMTVTCERDGIPDELLLRTLAVLPLLRGMLPRAIMPRSAPHCDL